MADLNADAPQAAEPSSSGPIDPASAVRARRTSRKWTWILALLLLLALLAGLFLTPAIRERLPLVARPEPVNSELLVDERLADLERRLAAQEEVISSIQDKPAGGNPISEQRLSLLESEVRALAGAEATADDRIAGLARQMSTIGGAMSVSENRMRELLLVAVSRRLLDSGRPLGLMGPVFAAQFRPRDATAVDAMLAWSSAPISRRDLSRRLDELIDPQPAPDAGKGWWDRLREKLSGLVEVRSATTGDPSALLFGRQALAQGDLASAIARVEMAPQSGQRDVWLTDARRLLVAEGALDRLEMQLLTAVATQAPATALPEPAMPDVQPPLNAPLGVSPS